MADSKANSSCSNHAVVAFGPSQAGKSTTISTMLLPGQKRPHVGDGSGESVTEFPETFKTRLGLMMDCPGCNDSKLRFTNEEAGKRVAAAIAESGAQAVHFLIFESLTNDTIHLRNTLADLKVAFGPEALKGAIVIVTKFENVHEKTWASKLKNIRTAMEEHRLPESLLVEWTYENPPQLEQSEQFKNLRTALGQVQPVNFTALEDLVTRQKKRAQELHEQQVPEQVEESYVEYQTVEEECHEFETYIGVEHRQRIREESHGGLRGLLGMKKTVIEDVPHEVEKNKRVTKRRPVTRPVERKRMRERRLPVEQFMALALKQILQEDREPLKPKSVSYCVAESSLCRFQASVASEAVYHGEDGETISKYLHDIGHDGMFAHIICYDNAATFWCESSNTFYVAFRGTRFPSTPSLDELLECLGDVVADISIGKEGSFELDQMHGGFLKRARQFPLEEWEDIHKRIKNGQQVVLTGHSLGAATAGCLAFCLLDRFADENPEWLDRFAFIGFGSPMFLSEDARYRISSKKWSRCYSFVVNMVSHLDPVASWPLSLTKYVGNVDWELVGTYTFLQREASGVQAKRLNTATQDEVNIVRNYLKQKADRKSHSVLSYRKFCSDLRNSSMSCPTSKL